MFVGGWVGVWLCVFGCKFYTLGGYLKSYPEILLMFYVIVLFFSNRICNIETLLLEPISHN